MYHLSYLLQILRPCRHCSEFATLPISTRSLLTGYFSTTDLNVTCEFVFRSSCILPLNSLGSIVNWLYNIDVLTSSGEPYFMSGLRSFVLEEPFHKGRSMINSTAGLPSIVMNSLSPEDCLHISYMNGFFMRYGTDLIKRVFHF